MWYAVFFSGCVMALIGLVGVAVTEYPKVAAGIERDKAIDESLKP